MTEKEWLTCGSRIHMRRMLKGLGRDSPLRWIRFNLTCVDRVRDLIDDERCLHFLRGLEIYTGEVRRDPFRSFDDEEAGVREAIRHLWQRRGDPLRGARIAAARAVLMARSHSFATSENTAIAVHRQSYGGREERRRHCPLLRDVFGNPFRPLAFSTECRTETALALARGIYESRDFGAMPILADALQDAGCDNLDILSHCRKPGEHVRGCWVVDLVLGKT